MGRKWNGNEEEAGVRMKEDIPHNIEDENEVYYEEKNVKWNDDVKVRDKARREE